MSWQRRLAPLALVVAVSSACSGSADQPAPDQAGAATTTTLKDDDLTTTTHASTTVEPAPTARSIHDAPESLAFSSSLDLGRLFEIDGATSPAESVGSDSLGDLLSDGTLVQATNLRAKNGEIWVRVNTTTLDSDPLGWVQAGSLRPTTLSVERFDPDNATEFRRVSRVVVDDRLDVYSSPSSTASTTGSMIETQVAMHGGNDVLSANGDSWVDVIDPDTKQVSGWVLAESFTTLTSIEAKSPDGTDVDRRADSSSTYGGGVSNGAVTAVGCNAQQITFTATSSMLGSAIVFGNAVPTGTPLRGSATEFRWAAAGGSTVYIDAGQSVTFTFPSKGTRTWYFTTLGQDGQAAHETSNGAAALNASGRAVAANVQEFQIFAGTCAQPEFTQPTIDPYVYELPEEERDAAIAEFEAELAESNAPTVTSETNTDELAPDTTVEGVTEEPTQDGADVEQ